MKTIFFFVLALVGTEPAFAEFLNPGASRSVHLSIEVDGDSSTNPQIDVFGNPEGAFGPVALSINEFSEERGSASGNINHQSSVALDPTSLSASLTDSGAGNSAPVDGHRGTLVVYSQFQLQFASDTPFTFTLTANLSHSSGNPGNNIDAEAYGVQLRNGITGDRFAFYNLANPTGTTTLTVPAGSYVLDGLSGMGFDAVFGNPPATSYGSSFGSQWTFSAGLVPEPTEPTLNISFVDNSQARVTWSTNSSGYNLQFATSLPTSVWTTLTNIPIVIGDRFSLLFDTTVGSKFYRLYKP